MFYNHEEKANKTRDNCCIFTSKQRKNIMTDNLMSFIVHLVQYKEDRHSPLKEKEVRQKKALLPDLTVRCTDSYCAVR